nr:hypothetical protein [Tanacetum cinerariifolium]GEX17788.1 hypothetical protein [Tanacetum cinerariifolium]
MTLLNQDLIYLKYGNSSPNKYTLSLHKYPAVSFPEDDIKERTLRWVSKEALSFGKEFMIFIESYQQKVNLTTPTITLPGIERKKLFTNTSKSVIGTIYENNKKENRVMILKEIPKFCDVTLKRVLEINEESVKGVDVAIPLAAVEEVSNCKPVNVNYEASTSKPKRNKEASSQPKSNVNGKASTSQPKENKEVASQSNAYSALEKDNRNPMNDLVDETQKKVDVLPKKTPRKTRDDMEFNDMGGRGTGA